MKRWPLAVLLWAGLGCDDHLIGPQTVGNVDCSREPPLTWENFGEGSLGLHCNGCHSSLLRPDQRNGAPVDIDFDTWQGTLDWARRIHIRTIVEESMPPGGGPSPAEREMIEEWLQCEVLPLAPREAG